MNNPKYINVAPASSITESSDTTIQDDYDSPMSYSEWLTSTGRVGGAPSKTQNEYKKYVSEWSLVKSTINTSTTYKGQFVSYLKQLTYNYIFTADEQRLVNTVDYDNPFEVDNVTYIWAKRIKQLCEYIRRQREEIKFQPTKSQQRCTTSGIENIIHNEVLRYLDDEITRSEFSDRLDQLNRLKSELRVEVTELYDLEQIYHGKDSGDGFIDTPRGALAAQYNTINFDPYIFIDRPTAIKNIISSYNIDTNLTIESNQIINIPLSTDYVEVTDLPPEQFIDYIPSVDNLTIDTIKKLITSSIGVDIHYTSTDESGDISNSGILAAAEAPSHNITSPSINFVSNNSTQIKTIQQIGGFFTPSKLGLLTYASMSPSVEIKTHALSADTLYVYNDPQTSLSDDNEFGHPTLPITYHENHNWMRASKSADSLAGDIIDSRKLQKFYNYASDTEVNTHSKYGVSRFDDSYDFWTGDKSDVWSNSDVFDVPEIKNIPLEHRQESLLINNGQVHKWRVDIFGNEYAMYKSIRGVSTVESTRDVESLKPKYQNSLICQVYDGAPIKHVLTGLPVYDICIDGGSDSPTYDISDNITSLAAAELATSKTWKCSGGTCQPGTRFISSSITSSTTESGFSSRLPFDDFINGSYILPDICSLDEQEDYQLPACRIVDGYSVEIPRRYNELDYYELSGTSHDQLTGQDGDYFQVPFDDIWDAGGFDSQCANNVNISYKQNNSTKYIEESNLYGHTIPLSGSDTNNESSVFTANSDQGSLVIREVTSRYTDTHKKLLSRILAVVPTVADIDGVSINPQDQLTNNLVDFDVVGDVLIMYSINVIYINKIRYDYDAGDILPDHSSGVMIIYDNNKSIPLKHYYNESTEEIIIGTLTYSDSRVTDEQNSLLYPDKVYRVSTVSDDLRPILLSWPRSFFTLPDGLVDLDTTDIGHISYNERLNYYYITSGGVMQDDNVGSQFYVYQIRFSIDKDIPTRVTSIRPKIYYTGALDETLQETSDSPYTNQLTIDDKTGLYKYNLSDYLKDSFLRQGFDYDTSDTTYNKSNKNWINNRLLKPSLSDHDIGGEQDSPEFIPLFAPGAVRTFYFNLSIDSINTLTSHPEKVYKVEARFARPDISADHIDTISVVRSPLPNFSELNMSRLSNVDDLTDPRQNVLSYEYNFNKSPEECTSLNADECISQSPWDNPSGNLIPAYHNGDLYKFVVILHTTDGRKHYYPYKFILSPYNAGNCLNEIKITNVTSYVDVDYHECSLLMIESQSPRYMSPVVLRTESLEKITFSEDFIESTRSTTDKTNKVYIKQETVTNILNNV